MNSLLLFIFFDRTSKLVGNLFVYSKEINITILPAEYIQYCNHFVDKIGRIEIMLFIQ